MSRHFPCSRHHDLNGSADHREEVHTILSPLSTTYFQYSDRDADDDAAVGLLAAVAFVDV